MNANPARRFLAALVAVPLVALAAITTLFLAGNAHADTTTDPTPPPTTASSAPATSTSAPSVTVADVQAEINALTCNGSFDAQQGKITDDTFALINAGATSSEQLGGLNDSLSAKLKALNYCVGGTTSAGGTTTTGDPAATKTCADFATQAEAQAYLVAHPTDKALDGNGNGKACEDAADGSGKVVTGVKAPSAAPSTTAKTATSTPIVSDPATSTGTGTGAVVPNTSAGVNTGGNDW